MSLFEAGKDASRRGGTDQVRSSCFLFFAHCFFFDAKRTVNTFVFFFG